MALTQRNISNNISIYSEYSNYYSEASQYAEL